MVAQGGLARLGRVRVRVRVRARARFRVRVRVRVLGLGLGFGLWGLACLRSALGLAAES